MTDPTREHYGGNMYKGAGNGNGNGSGNLAEYGDGFIGDGNGDGGGDSYDDFKQERKNTQCN